MVPSAALGGDTKGIGPRRADRCPLVGVWGEAPAPPVPRNAHRRYLSPFDTRRSPIVPHMDLRTVHALVRFGMGPSGAEPPPADPSAWLLGQLRGPGGPWSGPVPSTVEVSTALRADRETKPPPGQSQSRALYRQHGLALVGRAIATTTPFRERLVWFWTNHFTVSLRHGRIAPLAAAFVEEAIRPHVTGRFQDMLFAVMRHPAMLIYLDNAGSVGPTARVACGPIAV